MSFHKSIVTLITFAIVCSSCAKDTKVSKRSSGGSISVSGHEGVILEDQGLELTGTEMKGSGSFVFLHYVRNISAKQSFSMKLSIEDGGFADFRSFAYNRLKEGLSTRFAKTDGHYTIEFGNGNSWDEPHPLPVDSSQPLDITIDVDNSVSPATVTVYSGPNPIRSDNMVLYQSPADGVRRRGFGSYYGFVLSNSVLGSFAVVL